MLVHDSIPNLVPWGVSPRSDPRGRILMGHKSVCRHRLLHFIENFFGLGGVTMDEQPSCAFRNPTPEENHDKAEHGANPKGKTPAEPDREKIWIQQHHRCTRAHRSADPI